jgi:peptide/nickel transport system substrate-binding protein
MKWNRQMIRWSTIVTLLLALGLTLVACNPQHLRSRTESQLILATPTDPKTFNFANNQAFPNIFLFTYQGLTGENGVTGAIEPALAESWQFSPNKKQIVFTLRSGLKWSDGQPLTADDVVFTYQDVVFNPKVPIEAKENLKIGEKQEFPQVRKIDDRQVEFTFPQPFVPFLRAVSMPSGVGILPKHALEASLKTQDSKGNLTFLSTWGTDTPPAQIIVNGPYKLESYVAGQRAVFRRNPYYWRKGAKGETLPKIDKIIWQVIENLDVQLLRFRSGDLDVLGDTRPMKAEYYGLLKQEAKRLNANVLNGGAWSGVLQFVFNLSTAKDEAGKPFVDPIKSKWFNNKAFRQAIAYAIDNNRINQNLFRGLGIVQHSPVSVQSPYFLTPDRGLKTYDYQPETAKRLLTEAGFKYDNQGQLFDADGHRVEFNLITNANNLVRVAIGSQIKQDLARIGIQLNFQAINFNVLVGKISETRDWDMHIIGFEGGVEPHSVANLWMSGGASHSFNLKQQPGQSAIQDYAPKPFEQEIDRLFIAGAQEFDETKRQKIYAQYQQVVAEELPIIYLVNDRALMAVRNDIKGLKYSGLPTWGLWNIDELDR